MPERGRPWLAVSSRRCVDGALVKTLRSGLWVDARPPKVSASSDVTGEERGRETDRLMGGRTDTVGRKRETFRKEKCPTEQVSAFASSQHECHIIFFQK